MKDLVSPQNILFFKGLQQPAVDRAPVYCFQCGYTSGCKCSNGDHPRYIRVWHRLDA